MARSKDIEKYSYLKSPRLNDTEFELGLTQPGSLMSRMLLNYVRVDADVTSLDDIVDWLTINCVDYYHIKSGYKFITVYFAGAIDKDSFTRIVAATKLSQN